MLDAVEVTSDEASCQTSSSVPECFDPTKNHSGIDKEKGDIRPPFIELSINKFGEKDTEKFPEGGYGWVVLIGTFFALNTTYGMVNTYGVYQIYYQEKYDTKPSIISLIGSLQPTIIYLSSIPVIWMHNTIGVRLTVLIGGLIMVFSLMMVSICNAIWQVFLAQGVLYGFGAGITFFTAMAVPPEWFKEKRALAVGITASGSSLGGVIWPIAFQRLVNDVGFGWANRIIAFIFLPLVLLSSYCIKSRFPKVKKQIMPNWGVCRDWKFVWITISCAIGFLGLFPPLFYITEYCARLGNINPNVSNYILAILNACSIVGRIVPPFIGDKIGRLNITVPAVLLTGILQFALWYPAKGEGLVVSFAVIWGIASGSFIAVFPAALGQLFGIKDFNSRLTVMFLISAPATLLGPSVTGIWIPNSATTDEGFNKVIIFSGTMMLASGILCLALRIVYSRKLLVFI
jgi:MFS family permease